ncbi:chemerin-like receptor 1 [Hemicordylus capensis]|uniref:chemerin-like receptor 1 n=1 Tax=Hemicordylus capensis TaxID=884348 RepID=UPI0023048115|nr:chemerin-like receptor 1 [Hemicordylus capensis]
MQDTTHNTPSNSACITDSWLRKLDIVTMVLNSLTCVLGVIGNGLVIFITGFRMKKTVKTIFFLNLAIADFTFTFFLPLTIAYEALHYQWPFGWTTCKVISIIKLLNLYSSIWFLVVISIDRCISVRSPVWARNHQTARMASWVALGVWVLSLVLSSPSINFIATLSNSVNNTTCSVLYGRIYFHRCNYSICLSRTILAFIIPFIVIIASYGAVFLRIRRSQIAQSGKPFKIITAVIVAFFVCWLPFQLIPLIEPNHKGNCDPLLVYYVIYYLSDCLAYFNSCLNPILYVFMGHSYRERLRWSLLSALENAFYEESRSSSIRTKNRSSQVLEMQYL